ncbi:MAG: hypothetical protein ABIH11_04220, partial [Candidatus Altiarchaeota archaeon]
MRALHWLFASVLLIALLCRFASAEDRDPCFPRVDYIDVKFTEPSCDISPGNWCGAYNTYCLEIKTRYLGQGIVNPILKTKDNPNGFSLTQYQRKISDINGTCPGGEYIMSKCYEPTETTQWDLEILVRTETYYNDEKYGRNYEEKYHYTLEPHPKPWPTKAGLNSQQQRQYFNWCLARSPNCVEMSEEKFIKDVGYFSFTEEYIPCRELVNGVKTGYSQKENPCNCCPPEEIDCDGFHRNLRLCEMYIKDISGG